MLVAMGKRKRLPDRIVTQITPICWNNYVKPVIEFMSMDEECVWIIGKKVHDNLWGKYVRGSNWIYQPNAFFRNAKYYEEKKKRGLQLKNAIEKCAS